LIVNGLVLANDGQKMSKRLKNYPDPMDVVNKYGADALRLFLINSPVVKAENLRFRDRVKRKFVSAKPENYISQPFVTNCRLPVTDLVVCSSI